MYHGDSTRVGLGRRAAAVYFRPLRGRRDVSDNREKNLPIHTKHTRKRVRGGRFTVGQ